MSSQSIPDAPESLEPPKKTKNSSKIVVVLIVVIIILAGGAIFVFEMHKTGNNNSSQNLKVAVVSASVVSSIAKMPLKETNIKFSSNYTILKAEFVEMNRTMNESSTGTIVIGAIQFTSSAHATSFFNQLYKNISSDVKMISNVTRMNSTYHGFSYYTVSLMIGNGSYIISIGRDGAFLFEIIDLFIYIPNFNTLVEDQINAM